MLNLTSIPSHTVGFATLKLVDWAALAAIVGAVGTFCGLFFVGYQLYVGNKERQAQVKSLRATATMLFQERFRESNGARGQVFKEFPLHVSLVATMRELDPDFLPNGDLPTWTELDELTGEQRAKAGQVINAFNDVAQYVVDGLELRSALQQYHLPILRVGALLNPYLLQINSEQDGKRALRIGRRIPILFNSALAYHRCNRKHQGRPVGLKRPAPNGGPDLDLLFFDGSRGGVQQFECFPDTPGESLLLPDDELSSVISAAEEKLRQ